MNICPEYEALDIGEGMLKAGAEVFRVEDTIKRILLSKGIKYVNVFCISSLILISSENGSFSRRVTGSNIDLALLDSYNSLSRSICENKSYAVKEFSYPVILNLICVIIATGSFCLYFGGTVYDGLIAGMAGIIIFMRKNKISISFSNTFADGFIASLIAGVLSSLFPALNYDKIMIGAIMLLVPGLIITFSIRDFMFSDTISGINELFEAVFTALAIAIASAFGTVVTAWIK